MLFWSVSKAESKGVLVSVNDLWTQKYVLDSENDTVYLIAVCTYSTNKLEHHLVTMKLG